MTKSIFLKTSSILWVIWGLVHMFAGVITIYLDTSAAVSGIADVVKPELLKMDYHPAAGAIINQHGFNLGWVGLVTLLCGIWIWRENVSAIFLAALVGGLTDMGYFIFMDLGGFVHFLPGTLMTIFSGTAIVLSFYSHFILTESSTSATE